MNLECDESMGWSDNQMIPSQEDPKGISLEDTMAEYAPESHQLESSVDILLNEDAGHAGDESCEGRNPELNKD